MHACLGCIGRVGSIGRPACDVMMVSLHSHSAISATVRQNIFFWHCSVMYELGYRFTLQEQRPTHAGSGRMRRKEAAGGCRGGGASVAENHRQKTVCIPFSIIAYVPHASGTILR